MVKLLYIISIAVGILGCSATTLPPQPPPETSPATMVVEPKIESPQQPAPSPTATLPQGRLINTHLITPTQMIEAELMTTTRPLSHSPLTTNQTGSSTSYPIITLDNMTELAEVYQWRGAESYPDFAWSSDGQVLVINIGVQFLFYDVETFTQTSAMTVGPYDVWSFAVQPMLSHTQSARLAVGGNDNSLQLWDASTTQPIVTFTGQDTLVQSMTFSLDGQQLVSASTWPTPTTRIWDTNTGELIEQLDHGRDVEGLDIAYSPDGQLLAELVIFGRGDKAIYVWEVDGTRLLHHTSGGKG